MEKFKIGVLSDLHFGEFARSIDCCPYPNSSIFEDDYFKIFLEFIKEKEFDINYLVVAGDITEKAKPEEFELASKHITNLLEILDIKKDKVICIPGNHDSDWDAVDDDEEDPTGYKREQRYAPYRYDNWIFNEVSGNKNITKEPFFSLWEFDNVVFFGFNSAWHDNKELSIHFGHIDERIIKEMQNEYESLDCGEKIKIFVLHHHLYNIPKPFRDGPDQSILSNSSYLMDFLIKNKFDLVIHGHQHIPYFKTYCIDSRQPIHILSSGSFSKQIDTKYINIINNQFHIIEIEGRDEESNIIYGNLFNWTYHYNRKEHLLEWMPSPNYCGITQIIPFGTQMLYNNFKDEIWKEIKNKLDDVGYLMWIQLQELSSKIKYAPNELVFEVLSELKDKHRFIIQGEILKELCILKGDYHE